MAQIVFVEQFYYPEGWAGAQLPRDITRHLSSSGYKVEVVCGRDVYSEAGKNDVADPRESGVRLCRIPRLLPGRASTFKLFRQIWFCAIALPVLLCRRRPEVFITQTNPPLVVPAVALAARLRRCPYIIIAQDLYPEVVFAHGMVKRSSLIGSLLRWMFDRAYMHASRVVSLGPTMSRKLIGKGASADRIRQISNWATGDVQVVKGVQNVLRRKWGLEGSFVVLYSGNFGVLHDIETPIRAVHEVLRHRDDIRLVFVGSGPRCQEAQELVRTLKIEYAVQFHELVPAELLPHSIGLADVALVTLRRQFGGLVVPSKLLGYMARGIPSLYVGPPGDVQQILDESESGSSFTNGEYEPLAAHIMRLIENRRTVEQMGARARYHYDQKLASQFGLGAYSDMLREVLDDQSSKLRKA